MKQHSIYIGVLVHGTYRRDGTDWRVTLWPATILLYTKFRLLLNILQIFHGSVFHYCYSVICSLIVYVAF